MIQDQTLLSVADNSGAKLVKCIKVLGGSKRRYARVGDIIVVAVRKVTPNGAIKKKHVTRAIVVRQRKLINRVDGSSISFSDNAVVILNKDEKPVGTRIFGPIAREIRENSSFMKIVSLAPEVW